MRTIADLIMAGGIASRSQKWNCRTNALAGKIVHFPEENTILIIARSENSRCFYPPLPPSRDVSGCRALPGGERLAEGHGPVEWCRSLLRQWSYSAVRDRGKAATVVNQRDYLGGGLRQIELE